MEGEREGKEKRRERNSRAHRRTAMPGRPTAAPIVLCDCCGDSHQAGFMVLHDRYAVCPRCIDFVVGFDRAQREKRDADPDYARSCSEIRKETVALAGEYSATAAAVRAYFGFS